ncbi:PHD finger protein 20 [Sarotherodon galilaeus]
MEVTSPSMLSDLTFLSDFSDFLSDLVLSSDKIIIVGDFNIHVDAKNDSLNMAFNLLLDSIGFSQNHFNHTLDLVLTYGIETEYLTVFPENPLLSDHFLIKFTFTIIDYTAVESRLYHSRCLSESASTITTEEQSQPLKSLLKRKAPQILKEYETTGTLSVPSKKLLVKTCIGDLVERCGYYPLSAEKLTVAKSIITTFPSLSVRVAGQGEGFEHYYDPVSHCGFLNCATLDGISTRGRDKLSQEDGNTSSTHEWVTLIKRLRPSAENLPTIMSGMEETYTSRRAWISKDSPTAAEIFREYPRFLDMPSLVKCVYRHPQQRLLPSSE